MPLCQGLCPNTPSSSNCTTEMGIQNKLADGIDEVDIIIAGGT